MLNVGIIGCGSIARQRHAQEYRLNRNANLVGCYDFDLARAERLSADFGCRVYESAEALLAEPGIDAVSICAANKYHAALSIAALNAGKHVLCEKPMAVSLQECEDMIAASHANEKRLLLGHNQRLAPAHMQAKRLLDSGELGRIISFQSTFGHKGPEMWSADQSANTWFFKKEAASFGSMADLGIHKIDLACYLVGEKVSTVFSTLATLDKKFPDGTPIEVDDNSVEILTFQNGVLGTVTTSWTHYGEECNTTVLYCERGIVKLYHNPRYSVEVVHRDGTRTYYELDRLQTNDDAQQTSSGVIDLFVEAVLENRETILDADGILDSMRAVFACLASAESGVPVTL